MARVRLHRFRNDPGFNGYGDTPTEKKLAIKLRLRTSLKCV
jgi:hypothetical protein